MLVQSCDSFSKVCSGIGSAVTGFCRWLGHRITRLFSCCGASAKAKAAAQDALKHDRRKRRGASLKGRTGSLQAPQEAPPAVPASVPAATPAPKKGVEAPEASSPAATADVSSVSVPPTPTLAPLAPPAPPAPPTATAAAVATAAAPVLVPVAVATAPAAAAGISVPENPQFFYVLGRVLAMLERTVLYDAGSDRELEKLCCYLDEEEEGKLKEWQKTKEPKILTVFSTNKIAIILINPSHRNKDSAVAVTELSIAYAAALSVASSYPSNELDFTLVGLNRGYSLEECAEALANALRDQVRYKEFTKIRFFLDSYGQITPLRTALEHHYRIIT